MITEKVMKTKQETIDVWCPLFGDLPREDASLKEISCAKVIKEARRLWGVSEGNNKSYPKKKLTAAHSIFANYPSAEAHAVVEWWSPKISGSHEAWREFFTTDIKKDISHAVKEAVLYIKKYAPDIEGINDSLIVAVFAIYLARDVINDIANVQYLPSVDPIIAIEMFKDHNMKLEKQIQAAELLLEKAEHAAKEEKIKEISPDVKRGKKSRESGKKGSEAKYAPDSKWNRMKAFRERKLQEEAEKIWKVNPNLSYRATAKMIINRFGKKDSDGKYIPDAIYIRKNKKSFYSFETIRTVIKKPTK